MIATVSDLSETLIYNPVENTCEPTCNYKGLKLFPYNKTCDICYDECTECLDYLYRYSDKCFV